MTGLEDKYIIKNNKRLRYGYTTGSCAAGATRGAARMLLSGEALSEVELQTPKGITLNLQLHDITKGENYVSCAVQKDAGDDPDTTNGILVYAKVEKISAEVAKNIIDNQNTDSKKVIIHSSIILDGGVGADACQLAQFLVHFGHIGANDDLILLAAADNPQHARDLLHVVIFGDAVVL